MFPHFEIFGRLFSSYAAMAVIGILISGFVICREVRLRGSDDTDAVTVLSFIFAGALVGSHLMYAVTNIGYFRLYADVTSLSEFFETTKLLFGGSVFYGGLIGGFFAAFIGLRITKLDKFMFMDIMSFGAPLFHGIARIGCFLGGCCYGIESEFGFTAHGNDWVSEVNGVSRFPVQLLESLCCLAIAAAMYLIYKKGVMKGRLFFVYLLSYAFVRFFDEYLRGDAIRGFLGPLSTSQAVSILVAVISVAATLIIGKCHKKQ